VENEELKVDLETIVNPFCVFRGSIEPQDFIKIQKQILYRLGPDEYFRLQLTVIHDTVDELINSLQTDDDGECYPNVDLVGNA
jgi:hypothetical protein